MQYNQSKFWSFDYAVSGNQVAGVSNQIMNDFLSTQGAGSKPSFAPWAATNSLSGEPRVLSLHLYLFCVQLRSSVSTTLSKLYLNLALDDTPRPDLFSVRGHQLLQLSLHCSTFKKRSTALVPGTFCLSTFRRLIVVLSVSI
jgi:hypothetical protein